MLFVQAGDPCLQAQQVYNYFYRVYFRDKGAADPSQYNLSGLFSRRAVGRRARNGNPDPDMQDLPVNRDYLDQVTALGFTLHCTSRWMNSVLLKTEAPADTGPVSSLPFVSEVRLVKDPAAKGLFRDKLDLEPDQGGLSPYDRPMTMINALSVHNSGFTGEGVEIAILDAGFTGADRIESLQPLRQRLGIRGTYDFVKGNSFVYDYHYHGTAVMSVLAGSVPDLLSGSAPGASYWLLRTEDPETEFPAEEDYWATGAEFADSAGADIISSSLGYFNFDDPSMNYKYSDLDGRSAFVTRVADMAASRGMLVVNSAGNERDSYWIHIIAPADGESVIAVGAVDGDKIISDFSSAGPSYDGRVKPDVVAQGVSVPVQFDPGIVSRAAGTSFSCPVISGLCACVLQAVPAAMPADIITAVRSAADRFLHPDSLYGYGIPDFTEVISGLQDKLLRKPVNEPLVFPNPFDSEVSIVFTAIPNKLRIEVFSLSGKLIFERDLAEYISRSFILADFGQIQDGVYLLRMSTPSGIFTKKIIKIGNRP